MTLKQLEAFYCAATCASFAVAAQRLHLSVSSLSKRISELEDSLGMRLFDRAGHRAALTDAGSELLPRAQALLQAAEALRHGLGRQSGLHGTCRFGVGELTALTWLPKLVARIRTAHPALALEPNVHIGEVLERRVEAGELDFAIVAGRSSRSTIASYPIAEARFRWCASARVAGRAATLSPSLLADVPLVTLPPGAGTMRILEDWLAAAGAETGPRITCNHWGAVAGLLAEGLGVGFLPQGWARALEKRGVLRLLESRQALGSLRYSFQCRRDDPRPLVQAMRELSAQAADFSAGALFS